MGTFGTLIVYLALLSPLAYGLLAAGRRSAHVVWAARRLRVRVYLRSRPVQPGPGSVSGGGS